MSESNKQGLHVIKFTLWDLIFNVYFLIFHQIHEQLS